MRVAGTDYASRGHSAIGLAVDGVPKRATAFKSEARLDESDATMLLEYERWLHFQFGIIKPDVVIVEELAVFQNKKTIRALSHREAVCLLVAKKRCPIVIHRSIRSARVVVFKDGSISKDDAWKVRAKFINFDFGYKIAGGLDKLDAMTLALAAPTLMERA